MFEIIFYETDKGYCPTKDFLDSLRPKLLAKTLRLIDLLEKMVFLCENHILKLFRMVFSSYVQNKDPISLVFSIFSMSIRKSSLLMDLLKRVKKRQRAKSKKPRNTRQIMKGDFQDELQGI